MLSKGRMMRYALALPLILLLTGCGTMTASNEIKASVCSVWLRISWSIKDTDRTLKEIKINNAKRGAYCQ